MQSERREFYQAGGVTWSLVFDSRLQLWYVEKSGRQGERVRIALAEFQKMRRDAELNERLAVALEEAGIQDRTKPPSSSSDQATGTAGKTYS